MSALLNGVHDRSSIVQKQYAFALGHLVRVGKDIDTLPTLFLSLLHFVRVCFSVHSHQTAKDSSIEKLLLKLNNWYLEKEGKTFKLICIPTKVVCFLFFLFL